MAWRPWVPRSVQGLLAGGVEGLDVVKRIVDRVERLDADARQALQADGVIAAGPRLLAPVPKPALVLAAGLSYRSHNAEMAGSKAAAHPTGFLKAPSSIAAPGAVLRIPRQAQDFVDFEGELTCVFGRRCHNVTAAEAGHYIGGYTIANDVSARDWVQAVFQAQDPWEARQTWDVNLMGKQFAGFTPVGTCRDHGRRDTGPRRSLPDDTAERGGDAGRPGLRPDLQRLRADQLFFRAGTPSSPAISC